MKPLVARLVVVGAAVGSLALLAGAVMLVLRLAQPTEYPIDLSRAPDGEIVGRVAKIEPGTILLSSEPAGGGVVPLVVTKDTRVMVGTADGWMADVRPGGQIKVVYDLYEGRKLARSVEVLPEQGARHPAPVEPPAKPVTPADPPAAVTSMPKREAPAKPAPAPLPTPETPAPRPKPEPPRVAQPKAPTPVAPIPAPPMVVTPPPAAVTPPPAPAPPPRAPEPPVRAQEPARPQGPESTDGSEAVDWLLKGRR